MSLGLPAIITYAGANCISYRVFRVRILARINNSLAHTNKGCARRPRLCPGFYFLRCYEVKTKKPENQEPKLGPSVDISCSIHSSGFSCISIGGIGIRIIGLMGMGLFMGIGWLVHGHEHGLGYRYS